MDRSEYAQQGATTHRLRAITGDYARSGPDYGGIRSDYVRSGCSQSATDDAYRRAVNGWPPAGRNITSTVSGKSRPPARRMVEQTSGNNTVVCDRLRT
jgi:hypothetical protein